MRYRYETPAALPITTTLVTLFTLLFLAFGWVSTAAAAPDSAIGTAVDGRADGKTELVMGEVPWRDGEFLHYRMRLPTGKVVGSIYLMAESTVVDGTDAWKLELHRFVGTRSDNFGVSRVFVDRETQRPIRSTIRHGMLGNAVATYDADGVVIDGDSNETSIEHTGALYDNDQAMHLMRLLPLAEGYEANFDLMPIWTGVVAEAEVEVLSRELCKVPAGEFDCFEVKTNLDQTYWYGADAERYPLRIDVGGLAIELVRTGRIDSGAPIPFLMQDFGFSGILPPGWLFHTFRQGTDRGMLRLLDPEAAAISAIEVDRCPKKGCPSLLKTAEKELAGAERRFDDYTLRQGSWKESEVDGRPAISFVGDYQKDGEAWVQYRAYTFTDQHRLELIFRAPADRFEGMRADFDFLITNLAKE